MRKQRTWILALGVALIVAVVGAGAVMAQSGGGEEPAPEAADDRPFIDRVAEKLGVEANALQQAIRDVRNEDIDAAVARGDLTRERADDLKQKLDANPGLPGFAPIPFAGPPFGEKGRHPFPGPGPGPGGLKLGFGFALPEQEEALAGFLGISVEQLHDELQSEGTTLATVAAAHGKSRDDLKGFLLDAASRKLEQAVDAGDLPQERADEIRARLEEHLDELIDHETGAFKARPMDGPRFRFEFRGEWIEPAPQPPPAEQSFEG